MISLVLNALIGFIVLILQSSSLRGIAIGGILPDLLLLLTVSEALSPILPRKPLQSKATASLYYFSALAAETNQEPPRSE